MYVETKGISGPPVAHSTCESTALKSCGPFNYTNSGHSALTRTDGCPVPILWWQGFMGETVAGDILRPTQLSGFAEPKEIAIALRSIDLSIAIVVQAVTDLDVGIGWDTGCLAAVGVVSI